jgi:hypothetical protein
MKACGDAIAYRQGMKNSLDRDYDSLLSELCVIQLWDRRHAPDKPQNLIEQHAYDHRQKRRAEIVATIMKLIDSKEEINP